MGVMCMSDRYKSDHEGEHSRRSNRRSDRQRKQSRRRSSRHQYPERGWIQFLILRMLHEQPMHGYQLKEQMEERGLVQPKRLESGTMYTVLRRMEKHGYLESKWERKDSGPDRRTYTVTEAGVDAQHQGFVHLRLAEITVHQQHPPPDAHG